MAAHQSLYESVVADVDALRQAGFSDGNIVEVVGYYAYANRIADGLGLETESWIRNVGRGETATA